VEVRSLIWPGFFFGDFCLRIIGFMIGGFENQFFKQKHHCFLKKIQGLKKHFKILFWQRIQTILR